MIESTFLLLIALIYVASSFAFIRGTIKSAPFMKPSLARSTTYKERQNDVSTSVDISPHSGAVDVSTFDSEVPRLYGDSGELINWVERYGGTFNADIALDKEGWSLSAPSNVPTNTALVRIPKKLCIYAEPTLMGTPLLDSTSSLMNSLHSSQWRARLAIAVLSERVRPESFFGPYIRNLPFEFWGMPLFYTASELRMTQDYSVLQRTRSRIRFLSEFTTTVLASLQKTPMDPFSGNIADVNALAWGFAAASSRALRDIPSAASTQYIDKSSARIIDTTTVATIGDGTATTGIESTTKQGESSGTATVVPLEATAPPSGPVMIPMIDFASHSFAPSCAVRDTGTEYVLYTVRPVRSGEELTINYGALSNAELLDDYGFTVDNNPYDSIRVKVDDVLINTARAVMGQSNYSTSVLGGADGSKRSIAASSSDGANWVPDKSTGSLSASGPYIPQYTGKQSTAVSVGIVSAQQSRPYSDRSLREWQKVWLQCLDMDNIGTLPKEVTFGSLARVEHARGVTQAAAKDANPRHTIDPRLLAFLRVIYSTHEADLLVHGYTPFTLQSSGSMLAAPVEAHVTRTLIGMLFLVLRSYGTSLVQDVKLMKTGLVEAPQDPLKPKEELALKGIPAPATKQGGLSLALYQHGWFGDNSLSSSLLHVDTATLRGECRQVLQDCLQAPNPAFATRDRASAQDQVHVPATPTVAEASAAQVTQIPPTSGFDVQINTAAHASAIIHSTQRGSVDTNLLYLASGSESISGIDVAADAEVVDLANIMRQMGQKLPVNVREAYKFRIRRKKLLRDLMLQLADLYELLRADHRCDIPGLLEALDGDKVLGGGASRSGSSSDNSKLGNRTAQIRELLGEEKRKTPKDEALLKLKSLASKWAASSGVENLNL